MGDPVPPMFWFRDSDGHTLMVVEQPLRRPSPPRDDDRDSRSSSSRTAASSTPTATGCSARCTTPTTLCRRPCCAPGAAPGTARAALLAVVAVHDRHERLPDRARAPASACSRATSGRRPSPHDAPGEPLVESVWIEPYPDETIGLADGRAAPEARYEQREAVELAFVAALQHLGTEPARGPDPARGARLLRAGVGRRCSTRASRRSTARCSGRGRRSHERVPRAAQQATLRSLGDRGLRDLVDRYVERLGALRRRRLHRAARRGRDVRDAAAVDLVQPRDTVATWAREYSAVRRLAVEGDAHPRQRPARARRSTPGTTAPARTCRSRSTCSR